MQSFDLIRRAAACALAALVVSCGGGSNPPAADPSTKATLGAAGGSLKSPDGHLTLTSPAGALGNDTEITITEQSTAKRPALVQAQEPARVYALEPSGLKFAQPLTASVDLAPDAAGGLAFGVLHSGGTFEPLQAQALAFAADRRRLSGQLNHFSELLVFEEQGVVVVTALVEPRSIRVGETLDASLIVDNRGGSEKVIVTATANYISTSNPADLEFVAERETPYAVEPPLELAVGAIEKSRQNWRCLRPHTGEMRFSIGLTFSYPFVDVDGKVLEVSTMTVSKLEPAAIDYLSEGAPVPVDQVRTGVFTLRFGMTLPDDVTIVNGQFAGLTGDGPHVLIAGSNGAVAMDLVTGLSSMNQTPSGPDGAIGANLLGVAAISRPNPGPGTAAALFGTTQSGSGLYLRNWDIASASWGLIQISPLNPHIDASNAGGRLVADEMVTVSGTDGIGFVGFDAAFGFYTGPGSDGALSRAQLGGAPRSAALPSAQTGAPVLVGIPGVAGGANAKVVVHTRVAAANASPLFSLDGPGLQQLRCAPDIAGIDVVYCAVTGGDHVYLFRYLKSAPTATPQVTKLATGAGALGVEFGTRAVGGLAAVVSNFDAGTLNIITFGADGSVAANRSQALPVGVTGSAHAVPFAHDGKNYVAGTGNGSDNYFVFEDN